jgi:hypothetical protein
MDFVVVKIHTVCYPARARNYRLLEGVQTGSGAHPASYPMGTGALSPGVKRPSREAEHSSLFSAEVKNGWSYTSTPHTSSLGGTELNHGTNLPLRYL